LVANLRTAGYTPEEVDIVFGPRTSLRPHRRPDIRTERSSFQMPTYTSQRQNSDFWLSPEIAAKAPKDAQQFFQSAQGIAAPYNSGRSGTRLATPIKSLTHANRTSSRSYPGTYRLRIFVPKERSFYFGATSCMCSAFSCRPKITVVFDVDPNCGLGHAGSIASQARKRGCLDRGATHAISRVGSPHKESGTYRWAQWHLPITGTRIVMPQASRQA